MRANARARACRWRAGASWRAAGQKLRAGCPATNEIKLASQSPYIDRPSAFSVGSARVQVRVFQ